jgi:succinoglycan biosynthesis transport protein ExoP
MNQATAFEGQETLGGGFLNHLPAILWQRRWLLVIPLVLLSIAGIVAAFTMPAVYRSKAVLSVESPSLPREIVGSPVTALIDQRIAKIRQEVLSRGNLIEIIQQHNLYAEERAKTPLSKIIDDMREATIIEPISANFGTSGNDRSNTIAFAMSFDYESPAEAQLVMQEFVERFLDVDSTEMAAQAENTVAFLSDQAGTLQKQIVDIESRITDIKARNGLALASGGMITQSNAGSYDAQIAALQRENNLLMQRARMTPKDAAVTAAEAQLAGARAIYSDDHPDVRIARQRVAEARKNAASTDDETASLIASQIASNNTQIEALSRARSMEMQRTSAVTGAQARAPVVMEEINQLEGRADALRTQYQDVANKLLGARTAAKMETEQKGERLSVTDPPVIPDSPVAPNRPMLILGGILAGGFLGLALALAAELMMRPIRDVGELESLLGVPPLVVIPTLGKPPLSQRLRFWRRRTAS